MSDLDKYLAEAGKRLQRETHREVRSAKWLTTHAMNQLEHRLLGKYTDDNLNIIRDIADEYMQGIIYGSTSVDNINH